MLGNNDIFDEEELLAIANDGGGSSSSSCHSSASEASDKDDEDDDDDDDEDINSSSPSQTPKAAAPANTSTAKNDNAIAPNVQKEQVDDDGSSSSSDDSDDGFLESFFDTEKKLAAELAEQSALVAEDRQNDKQVQGGSLLIEKHYSLSHKPEMKDEDDADDAPHGKEEDHNKDKDDDASQKQKDPKTKTGVIDKASCGNKPEMKDEEDAADDAHGKEEVHNKLKGYGEKETKMDLGASVLHWISSANKPGRTRTVPNYHSVGGVVAIRRNDGGDDSGFLPTTSVLRLTTTTSAKNPRKRPLAENKSAKVTLEEVKADITQSTGKAMCGQIVHAADAKRGAMVDCLARYDPQKGCYILEIVDLSVDNLEPMQQSEAVVRRNANPIVAVATIGARSQQRNKSTKKDLFDPHAIAKRAEAQVRKLKQGRRRSKTRTLSKKRPEPKKADLKAEEDINHGNTSC